ncbi:CAP domain-containing protein [Flavobacterium sp. NRK F7]|uniref:CAP domain-containing protein n=1 Tax=Flavobacterium sp. NRK F7 TaxID=2954930 RepID=UPI0020903004|nr:CAP domain-containing protein [Flavobacterium sp. NRK F7]MCO6163746.1 CAP domain-containing protein [Flavobacterium sp. NRK F7]
MRYFLPILLALVTFQTNAQELTIDYNRLNEKVIALINEHRNQLQLSELKKDAILFKAAKDQSLYMLENKILTHEQNNKNKQFPKDRVLFYEGNMFQFFGENVLFTTVEPKKYSTSETDALAKKLFLQWKHSPPHYKNIIHTNYDFTDLAFSYDKKLKRLYATNVFGTKGIIIPNQLSENAFGIQEKSSLCKKVKFSDKIHLGNGLQIEGNEVILYYYDLEKFKTILNEPSDAIAIDFIDLEQFQCGQKNQFDVSSIYDGTLSKPIYRKELLENNRAENKLKLITKVGEVPPHLIGKQLALSMVFVLNNCACEYFSPVNVETKSLQLLPVAPILELPKNTILSNKGIIKTDEHQFAFGRNEIIEKLEKSKSALYQENDLALEGFDFDIFYDTLPERTPEVDSVPKEAYDTLIGEQVPYEEIIEEIPFEILNTTIHSSQIYSFSSIEGNEAANIKLHQDRAKAIEKYGKDKLNITIPPNKVVAEENWETCYIQLEMENLSRLAQESKQEIRKYINLNKNKWEAYLDQQRVSKLIANYYGEIKPKNPNHPQYLEFLYQVNLRTGVYEKNNNKTNLALAKIAKLEYDTTIFEEPVFQEIMTNANLVQNATAVLIQNYSYDYFNTTRFLKYWFTKYDTLSQNAQFNLLILYCVTNEKLLNSWDIATSKLANVTKPKTLENQFDFFKTTLNLIANYHYVSLYYCNHNNDYDGINFYFEKVYYSFKNSIRTSKDRVNLALFLNDWSSYTTTITLLKEEMKKPTFSKEEALILAQTYPMLVEDNGQTDPDLDYILKKVYKLNKKEWCEWQNDNSNLLRNNTIKTEYCKICQ